MLSINEKEALLGCETHQHVMIIAVEERQEQVIKLLYFLLGQFHVVQELANPFNQTARAVNDGFDLLAVDDSNFHVRSFRFSRWSCGRGFIASSARPPCLPFIWSFLVLCIPPLGFIEGTHYTFTVVFVSASDNTSGILFDDFLVNGSPWVVFLHYRNEIFEFQRDVYICAVFSFQTSLLSPFPVSLSRFHEIIDTFHQIV